MKYFLVVASPRTGSTLVVKCLSPYCTTAEPWTISNSHNVKEKNNGWTNIEAMKYPDEYLEFIFTNGCFSDGFSYFKHETSFSIDSGVFGAKIHLSQLADMKKLGNGYEKLLSLISSCVLLRRKNLTEQVISHKLLRNKGEKIRLDISQLKNMANNCVGDYKYWSDLLEKNCSVIHVWYEDYEKNILEETNNIRRFLGIPVTDNVDHGMKKLRSKNMYRKIISNYDEIVQEMGDTYGVPFGKPATLWKDL